MSFQQQQLQQHRIAFMLLYNDLGGHWDVSFLPEAIAQKKTINQLFSTSEGCLRPLTAFMRSKVKKMFNLKELWINSVKSNILYDVWFGHDWGYQSLRTFVEYWWDCVKRWNCLTETGNNNTIQGYFWYQLFMIL